MKKPKLYRVKTDVVCCNDCYYCKTDECCCQCNNKGSQDNFIIIDHPTLIKMMCEIFQDIADTIRDINRLGRHMEKKVKEIEELNTCEEYKD